MSFDSPEYRAWQEAERCAAAAETALFAKVLSTDEDQLPTRAEVEHVRALREAANQRLKRMVEDMRVRAASLRYADSLGGDPLRDLRPGKDTFTPDGKRG
jgi:hypothetical protein